MKRQTRANELKDIVGDFARPWRAGRRVASPAGRIRAAALPWRRFH
jgi:hypothetical protein